MTWAEPYWLFLLVLVPVLWLPSWKRRPIAWPTLGGFPARPTLPTKFKAVLPLLLRSLLLASIVIAMARPRTVGGRTRIAGKGVAIVVLIDQSSSMKAIDGTDSDESSTRLETAKACLSDFIGKRSDDLIGLVAFANYPTLVSPLTLNHSFLLESVRSIRITRPSDDGTNLGDAMIWGLRALDGTTTAKKVLILLTDGRNSPAVPEPVDPEVAAGLARELGVNVHTIAVGRPGGRASAVEPVTKLEIRGEVDGPDLDALARIAQLGGGEAFVADDPDRLADVFITIDRLEKSPVRSEILTRYDEHFGTFAAIGLALLVFDRILIANRLRRLV